MSSGCGWWSSGGGGSGEGGAVGAEEKKKKKLGEEKTGERGARRECQVGRVGGARREGRSLVWA